MKSWSLLCVALSLIATAHAQCPPGWQTFSGNCWYFSSDTAAGPPELSWQEAESFCQKSGGHLAYYETQEEEDWVWKNIGILMYHETKWWIGLNDLVQEGRWEWIGNPVTYDESLSFWQLAEPNNKGEEDCVEVFVFKPTSKGRWNDASCDRSKRYICKAPSGQSTNCPDGWSERSGSDSCYKVMDAGVAWHQADLECKAQGSWLVSITSAAEQSFVENLISSTVDQNYFIGYSDTETPGTLAWVDPSAADSTYTHWKTEGKQPSLPWTGSTCIEISKGDNSKWMTVKCSAPQTYVCERGLLGDCPDSWILLNGKCYEMVINANRVQTWTRAKEECQRIGATLLKIESDDEQTYFASMMEAMRNSGITDVWLGGSDIGMDGTFRWSDGAAITQYFWQAGFPQEVPNRDDCLTLYTGNNINNWESGSCFRELPYVCTVPEGAKLTPDGHDHITIDGKCDDNWKHYNGKCYYLETSAMTQPEAITACEQKQAILTSVLDADEQSFLSGHQQEKAWIGLEQSGSNYQWIDGETLSFNNWKDGATKTGPFIDMKSNGEWMDETGGKRQSICKKEDNEGQEIIEPPTTIPSDYDKCGGGGWFSDPASTQCYMLRADQTRTWKDSRSACKTAGGDLASINTPNEQKFIEAVLVGVPTVANVWIGLMDENPFGHDIADLADSGWAWSDGSPLPFVNWGPGEPNNAANEDCGELYVGDGTWNDLDCFSNRHYFCEKKGHNTAGIGDGGEEDACQAHEECCFRHLGAEYGSTLPNDALTASSENDQYFGAWRGRLNTPDDIIDLEHIQAGQGHGGWQPKGASNDPNPYLQVDFPEAKNVKGVITQGRNGIGQLTDRDWVTKFKIGYSTEFRKTGADVDTWEILSDIDGNEIIFKGNSDQNTQVTNIFPRDIVAKHMRLYVVEFKEQPVLRLEYIGCTTSCNNPLGMSSGLIADSSITASSFTTGHEAIQARAPHDERECLADATDNGADYRGFVSRTTNGNDCQMWSSQSPHAHQYNPIDYPDAGLKDNNCRNPDKKSGGPWCYTSVPNIEWEYCTIPTCPAYTPVGWTPTGTVNEYVQVNFGDYFKVSGITMHGGTTQYVKTYAIQFSDDGTSFKTYKNQANQEHVFKGLDGKENNYQDLFREPIATKFIRIVPRTYTGGAIIMQFEINGCYNDQRITCEDTGLEFTSALQVDVTLDCPAGCAQDTINGKVYGGGDGDPNYAQESAICPAAIHAGTLNDYHGGSITYRKVAGQSSYKGSLSNSIVSADYGSSASSINFEGKVYLCDTANGWKAWKDHCYYLSPKTIKKNWHDARSDCVGLGGDLASIGSSGENDFIETVVWQQIGDFGGDVWIGLTDMDQQNYYQWVDGSAMTYTKWSFNEPNGGSERCVQFIRLEGYWNDLGCDDEIAYMCKKPKELLPVPDDGNLPVEEGCDPGWSAYESSCYIVSSDEFIFIYAQEVCEEKGGNMVSIHNDYEQAFVHSLVTSVLPYGYNYTAWIGLAGHISDQGQIEYLWESDELTTYTNWNKDMPQTRFGCVFPFTYKGKTYYECTTENHPARLKDTPWCSMTAEYKGFWMNCGNKYEYACTYLDQLTGFWNTDICGLNYYYVCEKPRVGYVQPVYTSPNPNLACASGWLSDHTSSYCYKVEEYVEALDRKTWQGSVDYCAAIGGDLVSVHSADEQATITSVVQQQTTNTYVYFWTGLNNQKSLQGYEWSDRSPVDYTFWNAGEPNNAGGVENCVEGQFYTTTDAWNDISCGERRNLICKIAKGQAPVAPPTDPTQIGHIDAECGTAFTWIGYTTSYGAEKCYLFKDTDETMTWQDSNDFCTAQGGNLVAVHSNDENDMLLSWTTRSTAGSFWIGLHDVGGRAFRWADQSPLDYVNWAAGEPNNYYDSEGCVNYYKDSGLWNDENCGTDNYFICEKFKDSQQVTVPPTLPQQGNCPAGFTPFGNNCYISSEKVIMNWDNARAWCKGKGADLVAITNSHEEAFLVSFLWGVANNFWIGLTDRNTGFYVWIDQTDYLFTNWQPGEPSGGDEGCVEMRITPDTHGQWNDLLCTSELPFVCYARKNPSVPAPAPTVSAIGCPSDYYTSAESKSCFKLMTSATNWNNARSQCQSQGEGFDLASISELYDNDLLYSWFLQDITTDSIWLGLQYVVDDRTARVQYMWSDDWPMSYTNWDANEPSGLALQAGTGCGRMMNHGKWQLIPDNDQKNPGGDTCGSTNLQFVCKKSFAEIPPPPETPVDDGVCDVDWLYSDGKDCFYIEFGTSTAETRSWLEAQYSCQQRHGDLASFHSQEEVDTFIAQISGTNSHNLYIGLSSNGYEGWTWSDRSAYQFSNWGNGEPNGQDSEDCVEMYPWDGTWNDVPCSEKRGFICKRAKKFSQCKMDLSKREECGFAGITEDYCVEKRGCCWDPTYVGGNISGCFYSNGGSSPVKPDNGGGGSSGLSGGAIVGILFAVVLAIAAGVFGVIYYKRNSESKSVPSTSYSANKSTQPVASTKGGFDNPMVFGSSA